MTAPVSTIVGYPIALPEVPPLWRGDPFDWKLALEDSSGNPVNLTGYGTSWLAEARVSASSLQTVLFAVDTTHVAAGYIVISLTGDQTGTMTYPAYQFDVQATGGARSPFTVWKGQISLDGDYTRG